jgi:hypothetical protein
MREIICALGLVVALGATAASAGPCTTEIADVENAVNAPNSQFVPTARQTIGAQDSRQPTPSSVATAEQRADAHYNEVLGKAKALDAANNSDCKEVVRDLKLLVGMNPKK